MLVTQGNQSNETLRFMPAMPALGSDGIWLAPVSFTARLRCRRQFSKPFKYVQLSNYTRANFHRALRSFAQSSISARHLLWALCSESVWLFPASALHRTRRKPSIKRKKRSRAWFMPMAFRKVGPGTLQLRAMFSFEPFTFPPGGSPLLFQTGETYKGQGLIDRQHPHDLFMELSAQYTVPIGDRATWFAYLGYPGEPALGPAFMHRASASENASAPLSHHLQDSTHISFGVFTSGFTYRWFKVEGSVFNGREPGENRYNFEAHPWNSRSARLSFAPNSDWSMQVSHGLLRDPEALEPGDVRRTTASVSYNEALAAQRKPHS